MTVLTYTDILGNPGLFAAYDEGGILQFFWRFLFFFFVIFYNMEFRSLLISPQFEKPIRTFEEIKKVGNAYSVRYDK